MAVGTATARGSAVAGRSIGEADGAGEVAFTAFAVFSGSAVFLALAVPFFFVFDSFFAADFFFADLDFAGSLDDFFVEADGLDVGLGVASALSDSFFCAAFVFGLGDVSGVDEAPGLDVSLGFGFALGFGVGEGVALFFSFLVFGDGLGDALTSRVLRNGSRVRASSSLSCARMTAPIMALSVKMIASQMRKRGTAERNRGREGFKLPALQWQLRPSQSAPVRDAGLRSICRRAAEANKSDTSR